MEFGSLLLEEKHHVQPRSVMFHGTLLYDKQPRVSNRHAYPSVKSRVSSDARTVIEHVNSDSYAAQSIHFYGCSITQNGHPTAYQRRTLSSPFEWCRSSSLKKGHWR